jgi:hypothetical protein
MHNLGRENAMSPWHRAFAAQTHVYLPALYRAARRLIPGPAEAEAVVMELSCRAARACQKHPDTGAPLSVCPLTWSHAAFVLVVLMYLDKLRELEVCPTCGNPMLPRYTSGHLLHMR